MRAGRDATPEPGRPSTDGRPGGRRATWVHAISLILLALAAHGRGLTCGFIWDDDDYVLENPNLGDAAGLAAIWTDPSATPQYYPLVHTTYWLEHACWGLRPVGYHAVNIALHAAGSLLVWGAARRLGLPWPWFVAAVFAVHPLHVESVAWVTERKNVLSGVFYFATWYVFAGRPLREGWTVRSFAVIFLLFLGGLLSKSVTATWPAAALVALWWRDGKLSIAKATPLFALAALGIASGSFTAYLEYDQVGARGGDFDWTFAERVIICGKAVWHYAASLVWPVPLMFTYPQFDLRPTPWNYMPFAAVVAATAAAAAAIPTVGRGPLAALLLFGGTLFPVLGFLNVYPMKYSQVADHFAYHAGVYGIALIVACGRSVVGERGPVPVVASTLVLGSCLGLSWVYTAAFRDEETLWRANLETNPTSMLANINLGLIRHDRGEYGPAEFHYKKALETGVTPDQCLHNLSVLASDRGRTDEAIGYAREALELDPRRSRTRFNLALMLKDRAEYADAMMHLRRLLGPDDSGDFAVRAAWQLATILGRLGDHAAAADAWAEYLKMVPRDRAARRKMLEHRRRLVTAPAGDAG